MAKVIWSPRALRNFESILAHIRSDSPSAARRFGQQVLARVRQIETAPYMGGYVLEDETRTYREVLFGNYRVIYRCEPDGTVAYIVAVRHAAQLLDPGMLG
jgi:plasmid stabilization system protein ParE